MTTETIIVPLQDLYAFVRRAFVGLGLSEEEAELCADGLVQSELRGMAFQMQGVNRLPRICRPHPRRLGHTTSAV